MAARKKATRKKAAKKFTKTEMAFASSATGRSEAMGKYYSKLMPIKVIEHHAKKLKRNPRALAVYKRVLGV